MTRTITGETIVRWHDGFKNHTIKIFIKRKDFFDNLLYYLTFSRVLNRVFVFKNDELNYTKYDAIEGY